ncbi:nitroreductase family protein [Anaerovorax odorimutans]|uniref:Nitroreductase family protein n=1 Tax=Anaerovorax odorimutans TaxID=109327 RepID=A0ABT1RQQ3_9FIRM|nr:nitroreductase family protein [Anaerovorax odorimutans]MCQ4637528.1 nitroreductase family protein [Anaerovorax odorimutans]
MKQHRLMVDTNKCVGCGVCARVCAAQNLEIDRKKVKLRLDDCILCGQCTGVCPTKAISISGYDSEQIDKKGDTRLNPDEVLDVIRFRRTIRQFKQKEIPGEVIEKILEAGRLTHTAKNMQDVSFVVLDQEKNRMEQAAVSMFKKIKPLADLFSPMARNTQIDDHFFFFNAPTVIVILAKDKTNGILAAQNMEFEAEANGLGVLFSGFFTMAANASPKIKKALKVPKGKRVAMTLVLGYPDVKFLRSVQRKKLDVRYM